MQDNPKMKLVVTPLDRAIALVGWILVLSIWILTALSYAQLPDIIPIHYNGTGEADGFGNKSNLMALPIVATVLFVVLTTLCKYPDAFNYPPGTTPEKKLQHYTNSVKLLRWMKAIIVLVFGMIEFATIQNVNTGKTDLGSWFLPIVLGLIFTPVVYFIIKGIKEK